ncbi:type I restriction-modification system subunit M [Candidatus Saccharibacteria bacterium]|nr:type I restriction-modification system subunit M [Candidatus Saccharibacteria bacterium]
MSEDQKKQLQTSLWNIANELRGKMDADEFRDYILGFIFYKYLSEKLELYADTDLLASEGVKYKDIADTDFDIIDEVRKASLDHLGYFLLPSELFSKMAARTNLDDYIEDLQRILANIESSTMGTDSEEDFDKLFSELDLNANKLGKTMAAKSELIAKVLKHLDKIDFQLGNSKIDILGDAYEYLIGQFASGAGKKAGEFYTPQEVSQILARIVSTGKTRLKSVYDPACGSGSLLLRIGKYTEIDRYFGQEMNNTTYNLARMNMILHDVHFDRFDIKQEDTLVHPEHLEYKFEAVVANPPFSAKWAGDSNPLNAQDERFSPWGKVAPSSKADYAFITHMVHQLADNGTMAVVMPHGVLFRGAAEGVIRQALIERNYLDAVIGLPANLFYGTSIPACILVFKKCKTTNDVLFIDASKHFEKGKNQNRLRPSDIDKIMEIYASRTSEDKYSHLATLAEIQENDYNLNIPRYVDTFEPEAPIDLDQVVADIHAADATTAELDAAIEKFAKELGIKSPF